MRILALFLLLSVGLPLAANPATAAQTAPPQPGSEGQLAQCMTLQGSLSRQTTALAELQAHSQALSNQRELERMRNASRIQALENEKARLLSAAVIAVLILLLAAATGFGLLLRRRHRQLRRLSEIDVLTGLGNRRAAARKLDAMTIQRGPEGTRHVLFLIDVDHFKQINDGNGHHVGDEVLVALAAKLKAACRPTDLVARWGGEEFLVACTSLTREQAEQVATRLRRAMAHTLETAHATRLVTVSLGLAPIPFFDGGNDPAAASCWDYALRMADRALYAAKRHRDAWVGYWGAQLPDNATAEAVLEQPEAAEGIVTVMSSVPRIVATSMTVARARSLRALRAQG
jgi:diguanylate cyclase (GGDEF)-like protein